MKSGFNFNLISELHKNTSCHYYSPRFKLYAQLTRPQIFISTLYSSYNWSLFIEIIFIPTINTTYSILFVRSFHHHLFTLSKRTHYIIRSFSQAIISVLSKPVTTEVLHVFMMIKLNLKKKKEKNKNRDDQDKDI